MPTGVGTTYDLTVGVKLDFEDFIYILTPTDVPLQGTFNGTAVPAGPQRSILGSESASEKKVEWSEETLLTPRTTLGATALTADTFIVVASGDQTKFATGDLILIGTEYLRVTDYGTTTDSLVVTRAYAGSTAAQQANASDVVGVGTALNEGSDPSAARFKDRSALYNLTEIFGPYKISISGTEEVVQKYGVTSEFNKQVANRLRELYVAIEQATLYGYRYEDSANKRRMMGGLVYYIASNVDSATTSITEAKLLDQLQNSYNNGGVIDTVVANAKQKRNISAFGTATPTNFRVNINNSDRVRGQVVSTYESDFGSADIVLDRHVRTADLFGIDRQYVSYAKLRPTHAEILAKTGDAMNAQVLDERALKVRMEKRHFRFSALT